MAINIDTFIDIHTHILPGLDDGPKTMGESLRLARLFEQAGVKRIIATPHYLPGTAWSATRQKVVETVDDLQQQLDKNRIDLKVDTGMEIASHKRLEENLLNGTLLPLGNSNHYLVEPAFQGDLDILLLTLGSLLEKGQKLILAHPERVEYFQRKPGVIESFVAKGLKVQVNSGSVLGFFGEKSQKIATHLSAIGCVHFIASDAHGYAKRTPLTRDEWTELGRMSEGGKILRQCKENLSEIFA